MRASWSDDRRAKRVVVWGTGFVGRMVIPEIVRHPAFELVGVGVSAPEKVGRDVGEICGIGTVGVTATDDVDALISLRPDALVHYGPTAAHAADNIALMSTFLRAGIDVCSTAMTPWVWPSMALNPPSWIDPITEACEEGGASCFTTGIDPGFANDLFPMTLMGLCGEVRSVKALEILDYINYEGDYEEEMGIGRSPDFTPLLEHTDILVMSWGATVPMIAHAVGIELDRITTTWEKWVTRQSHHDGQGRHRTRGGGRHPLHHQRHLRRRDPHRPGARQPGGHRRRPRLATRHSGRRLSGRDRRVAVDHSGDGVPVHRRERPRCRGGRLSRHRAACPERSAGRERPAAGVGHPARSALDPRRRHDSLRTSWHLLGRSQRGRVVDSGRARPKATPTRG